LLTTTLLTATTFLAATTALFLAFALLAFTFLSLAISLLAALLSGGARFAWFVWILLSFHITFRCYYYNLLSDPFALAIRSCLLEIALESSLGLQNLALCDPTKVLGLQESQ
jgi:hypothetical protein